MPTMNLAETRPPINFGFRIARRGYGPNRAPPNSRLPAPMRNDLIIRFSGAALIGLALLSARWLVSLVDLGSRHPATPLECCVAAVAFVSTSVGAFMVCDGAHLFDPIDLSSRWQGHGAP